MIETEKARYERLDARLEEIRAPQVQDGSFSRTHAEQTVMQEEFEFGALEIVRDHAYCHKAVVGLEHYFAAFDWEFPKDPDR